MTAKTSIQSCFKYLAQKTVFSILLYSWVNDGVLGLMKICFIVGTALIFYLFWETLLCIFNIRTPFHCFYSIMNFMVFCVQVAGLFWILFYWSNMLANKFTVISGQLKLWLEFYEKFIRLFQFFMIYISLANKFLSPYVHCINFKANYLFFDFAGRFWLLLLCLFVDSLCQIGFGNWEIVEDNWGLRFWLWLDLGFLSSNQNLILFWGCRFWMAKANSGYNYWFNVFFHAHCLIRIYYVGVYKVCILVVSGYIWIWVMVQLGPTRYENWSKVSFRFAIHAAVASMCMFPSIWILNSFESKETRLYNGAGNFLYLLIVILESGWGFDGYFSCFRELIW